MSQRQTTFQSIMYCTLNMAIKLYYYYLDRQKFDPAQKPGEFGSMITMHVSVGNQLCSGAIL